MTDLPCTRVVELVTEYLEGALPAAEARAVEEHLATCPGCTEYVRQMRTIAGGLPATDDELPPALREGLLEAFRRTRP